MCNSITVLPPRGCCLLCSVPMTIAIAVADCASCRTVVYGISQQNDKADSCDEIATMKTMAKAHAQITNRLFIARASIHATTSVVRLCGCTTDGRVREGVCEWGSGNELAQ